MTTSYDPTLKKHFPNADPSTPFVINPKFLEFGSDIQGYNLLVRSDAISQEVAIEYAMYFHPWSKAVLDACQEHYAEHDKTLKEGPAIVLVHPFFMSNNDMHRVGDRMGNTWADIGYEQYMKRLMHVLKQTQRDGYSVVVYEVANDYALTTSMLVEEGLVDKVIFTWNGGGCALDYREIIDLARRKIFAGGMYKKLCFGAIFQNLVNWARTNHEVYVLDDLCINSPSNFWGGEVTFFGEEFPPEKIKNLEEVLKELNIPPLPKGTLSLHEVQAWSSCGRM